MIHRKVDIGLFGDFGFDLAKLRQFKEQIAAHTKHLIKPEDDGPTRFWVDTNGPEIGEYLRVIKHVTRELKIAKASCMYLKDQYVEDAGEAAEWYEMATEVEAEDQGNAEHGVPRVNAASMKAGVHSAANVGSAPYYSQEFKDFVERKKLSGLEFLWLPDIGKYRRRRATARRCSSVMRRGRIW
jgi:hypothetical protein